MQLQRIRIPAFRNLRDLDIAFASHLQPVAGAPAEVQPKPIRSHALIGQNGTGKSNLIEALITIFRDVDLDREAAFDYTLEYSIRGHAVRIEADSAKQKRPFVWVDDKAETQGHLLKNRELLPAHIFAYYSGRNERIEALFQEHQRRFNQRQEITTDEVLSGATLNAFTDSARVLDLEQDLRKFEGKQEKDLDSDELVELRRIQLELKPFEEQRAQFLEKAEARNRGRLAQLGDDRLRRLFYCRGGHSQLVLLACLLSDDLVFRKVLKNLHIESLESALFVLKEPHRLREKRRGGKFDEQELNEGDRRFWYARGNVVSEFLDKLWQVAWAPIEQEATKQIDFRGRSEKQKQLYLFVPSQDKLKQLGELVGGTDSFFRYAEGAYIGDLIDEVRITVKKRDEHGGKVSFTQLSEGELQMLTVLGLMRITREDHCLFLLDEPDTHLNPIWKLRYFDDIEGVLTSDDAALAQGESQILITTHDPMMVGSLKREQVHILRRDGNRTVVDVPDEHPQGMGVTGLLKSELFGLSSTLDIETERRLFRRNELFVKQPRSAEENAELSRLSAELADLGFSTADFRDPDYALFVRKMAQHRRFRNPTLTPEEQADQDAIADSVIDEILREEDGQ
ncbi:AAA family ATPase [Zoogloea oleivorans]|uniref:AAA family ATPase n=1 Tax=Zoogloea oleivorans TaxID=1552750 RepID=A0A6C2CE92_9RHOO|nr:AAA family ATPase [Zoogloea oleivorans]TYC52006.1 AAA family ATPase [Zoogloea oleivorans]